MKLRLPPPRRAVLSTLVPLLALAAGMAHAGNAAERIVVSATRSAQPELALPASIDGVDVPRELATRPQVQLSEALLAVPGLSAQSRQNHAQDLQVSSRGFGARASFGIRGIRLLVDGIPATMPDGQGQVSHVDLGSAERIEVLRGPFSVLYGNASGGVIAVESERAPPEGLRAAEFIAGADGTGRGALRLGGDVGPWNWLVSASHFRTDGYRQHSAATRDTLNAVLRYTPRADQELSLVLNALDMPESLDPQGLTEAQWRADPRQAAPSALEYRTRKQNDQQQLGLRWRQALDERQSLELTGWVGQRGVRQFLSIPFGFQGNIRHPGGVSEIDRNYHGLDARWTLRLDTVETTLGVAYEAMNEARTGYQNFIGSQLGVAGALRRDEDNRFTSRDAYAQLLWRPDPRWQLLAGVRTSEVSVRSEDHFIVGANGDDSGRTRFAATTPALGVSFAARPALRLYAAWGAGFETPTGNELAYRSITESGLNLGLDAARSRHREAGVKWLPTRTGRLTLARFAVDTEDEIGQIASQAGRAVFDNVGATTRRGWEVAWSGRLGDRLTTRWAWTRLDARYRDSAGTITAGNALPGAPRTLAYGELAWQVNANWQLSLEAQHRSRLLANDANTAAAPAYNLAHLSVRYEGTTGPLRWQPFLRVENLLDTAYVGSVIVNDNNGRFFEPAPGRSLTVGLRLDWSRW